MARWNKPLANGEASMVTVFLPPADSPNTVTLSGSPPKAEILLHLLETETETEIEIESETINRTKTKALVASMSDQEISDLLRAKSAEDLLSFFSAASFGMYQNPQIIEDGTVMPAMPMIEAFNSTTSYNAVPIITGTNRDEAKMFLMNDERMVDISFGMMREITDVARYELHNRYRSDVWQALAVDKLSENIQSSGDDLLWSYRFDWDEGGDGWMADYSQIMGAAHSLEIPFVFATYEGLTLPGVFTDENKASSELLSAKMMSYWAEFAYNGRPGQGRNNELPEWLPRSALSAPSMLLDSVADGGVRMGGEVITLDDLKQRLENESAFIEPRDRCELYVQMFRGSPAFVLSEYQALPGCDAYSIDEFSRW